MNVSTGCDRNCHQCGVSELKQVVMALHLANVSLFFLLFVYLFLYSFFDAISKDHSLDRCKNRAFAVEPVF